MERKDPGLSSPISDLRTAFRVKEEEQIISLCGEAERALKVLEGLTPEELASELPALLLRFRRLKASFEKAVEKLRRQSEEAGADTPEGKTALQFAAMGTNELRWITETLEVLKESADSLRLSEIMTQNAVKAGLERAVREIRAGSEQSCGQEDRGGESP